MNRKSKKITAVIGIATGAVILAGAAFASYNTSNGYDTGKLAVKGLMSNENYTAEMTTTFNVDGEEIESIRFKEEYDRDGDVQCHNETWYSDQRLAQSWYQDGKEIRIQNTSDGTKVYVYPVEMSYGAGVFDISQGLTDEDRKTQDKIIRFVELVGDTLVGDLKNNIVYVGGDDNSATYEMNLSSVQIPEFVNAGISALFSEFSMEDYDPDDFTTGLAEDPFISSVTLKFTVDNQGRLLDGRFSGTLTGKDKNGQSHNAEGVMTLKMSDYGTTVPERIDMQTLPKNTTYVDDSMGYHEYHE